MTSAHSAAGPALGYQFQADFALLELAKLNKPGAAITLEMHDDVAWEDAGTATELLQVKHSINKVGGLGDQSVSLWKTLNVWMNASRVGDIDGPRLHLVTTGTATEGSAAYALRPSSHNPAEAARLLLEAAKVGDNQQTQTIRDAFAGLASSTRSTFISKVYVVDATPNISDIDAAIRQALWSYLPTDPARADLAMESVWGWWRGRVVEMLSYRFFPDKPLRTRVEATEMAQRLQKLIIDFSPRGLPEFDDLADPDDEALAHLSGAVFTHQLDLIGYRNLAMRQAIVDFYRAFNSETRWLEYDFVQTDEVRRYEGKLLDAWRVAFGHMESALGDEATEEKQKDAGLALISKLLENTQPPRIRDHADHDFYYRGKHHMLADDMNVGWHPDFKARVEALLTATVLA